MTNTVAETLSADEAGKVLGIGRTTMYKLLRNNKIPCLRLGKKIRIPRAALTEFLLNPGNVKE